MPNLDFYAAYEDHEIILGRVLECGEFRVFELSSKPGREIVELTNLAQVKDQFEFESWNVAPTMHLQLLAIASGGKPIFRKITFKPGAVANATFRYACEGWGLIQLYLENPRSGFLQNSHTNHFSETGASGWSEVRESISSPPSEWNWQEIKKASSKLNSFIRKLALKKIGSRPILPKALEVRTKGISFLPLLG